MAERPDPRNWRLSIAPRLIVVAVLFGLWALAVLVRLVDLQIYQRESLEAWARRQGTSVKEEPAQRGDIVDRRGRVLAYTVGEDTLGMDPSMVDDPRQATAKLCDALGDCSAAERVQLEKRLGQKEDRFEEVRPWLSDEQARRVAALDIDGICLQKEPRRHYPHKELAAHVLGYVGVDTSARAGLESRYDRELTGTPGHVLVQRDAKRAVFSRVGASPVPGATLELTIDSWLQHLVERELRAGVEENRAVGGCALVMDPETGEILAMASEPTFDPNNYTLAPPERWRNRAVQDAYEPGSTFKLITGSAALEEKVMRPADLIDTGDGTVTIGRSRIIRETQGHRYGTLSFTDVIAKSSNVGAVEIGRRLGPELLGRYVGLFGFGVRLSPDFGGENAGIVWPPSQWNESTLASVSIGYEVSVTPLQMAAAASAVANGGELVKPRVVRAVIDGDRRLPVLRQVIRRVTSSDTAAQMTSIMEAVVERGTGSKAGLPDFTVAGKTGTTHKNRDGRYLDGEVNASFVGFVPSRKPALTILVLIDTPRGPNQNFGGTVAAPVFHRIAEAALRYLGVPPTINPVPPALIGRRPPDYRAAVAGPVAPVTIVQAASLASTGQIVLPELRGLSGREALRVLTRLGLTPRVSGNGIVISQDPLPGDPIEAGGTCRLTLGRPAPGLRP